MLARPMQTTFRARHLEAKTRRDFRDRHLLEVPQQNDLAVVLWQCLDTRQQISAQIERVTLLHLIFGNLVDRRAEAAHATLESQTLAPYNCEKPAGKRGRGSQPANPTSEDPERFLHRVINVAHLAMPPRVASSVDLTGRQQFIESRRVTPLSRPDQFLPIHPVPRPFAEMNQISSPPRILIPNPRLFLNESRVRARARTTIRHSTEEYT